MSHCQFEPALKFACIREALNLVRDDPTPMDYARAAQHLFCFGGCFIEMIKPDDGPLPIGVADLPVRRAELGCSAWPESGLVAVLDVLTMEDDVSPGAPGPSGVDWATLWTIVGPIVLELLKRWLEKSQRSSF